MNAAGSSTEVHEGSYAFDAERSRRSTEFLNATKADAEKTPEDLIAEAEAVIVKQKAIQASSTLLTKHEAIKAKISEKEVAVNEENYAEAERLKNEILNLRNEMTEAEKNCAAAHELEEDLKIRKAKDVKQWLLHRRMERETAIEVPLPREGYEHVPLTISVKHNGQIQWEVWSRKSAGYNEGEERTQAQIMEHEAGW